MGGLVEQQVDLTTKAFIGYDMKRAERLVELDQQVNALEKYIDHECAEIMARRQPVAVDLRMLIATIKMIINLARIGDEAVCMARMTLRMANPDDYPVRYGDIEHLLVLVKDMLHGALDAYARTDIQEVLEITAQDAKVDSEYIHITQQLITQMRENPKAIPCALDMLWTARALERIAVIMPITYANS